VTPPVVVPTLITLPIYSAVPLYGVILTFVVITCSRYRRRLFHCGSVGGYAGYVTVTLLILPIVPGTNVLDVVGPCPLLI